jgi:hypothetical protein
MNQPIRPYNETIVRDTAIGAMPVWLMSIWVRTSAQFSTAVRRICNYMKNIINIAPMMDWTDRFGIQDDKQRVAE